MVEQNVLIWKSARPRKDLSASRYLGESDGGKRQCATHRESFCAPADWTAQIGSSSGTVPNVLSTVISAFG
jgi:hypothetical protein